MRQSRNSWSGFAARIHVRSTNAQFMCEAPFLSYRQKSVLFFYGVLCDTPYPHRRRKRFSVRNFRFCLLKAFPVQGKVARKLGGRVVIFRMFAAQTINHARCRNLHYASFLLKKIQLISVLRLSGKIKVFFRLFIFVGFALQNHHPCIFKKCNS